LGVHVGDDLERVMRNRSRLQAALPSEPRWLNQVHGTAIHDADAAHVPQADQSLHGETPAGDSPVADAAITTQPGRVLAVLTADCVPVVLSVRGARALAVMHAGW